MEHFRIEYQRHATTGLLAATSPELKGFLVVARTLDELFEEIPAVAADLIRQKTGEEVVVRWTEQPPSASGFLPLASEAKVLAVA